MWRGRQDQVFTSCNNVLSFDSTFEIQQEAFMDIFTVRDLREHTGTLIHDAEKGKLSLITKRGRPVFLAVPFSKNLIELGLHLSLAIELFKKHYLPLEKSAKLADKSLEEFIEILGKLNIPVVNYSPKDLSKELKNFE